MANKVKYYEINHETGVSYLDDVSNADEFYSNGFIFAVDNATGIVYTAKHRFDVVDHVNRLRGYKVDKRNWRSR